MIRIVPKIVQKDSCPYCATILKKKKLIWQGIHICIEGTCASCGRRIISDLQVGHAQYDAYQIDLQESKIFGPETFSKIFFAQPLLKSFQQPNNEDVHLHIKKKKNIKKEDVIIINCLDYLYGHCVLKLFNANRHLQKKQQVIVLIPHFLEWLVPNDICEIWSVKLSLGQMQHYYPSLDEKINKQISRFPFVSVSTAHSHPNYIDIQSFTGVQPYNIEHWQKEKQRRVTFIWREDRTWFFSFPISYLARKYKILRPLCWWQNIKVRRLFHQLYRLFPDTQFTVCGVGTTTHFPDWIDDKRVVTLSPKIEKELCKVYSESSIIIGVHGSNMLLPSAHAGAVIDLLPTDREGNFGQDVMYHGGMKNDDSRLISFRYRYLPISTTVSSVRRIIHSMLKTFPNAKKYFTYEGAK